LSGVEGTEVLMTSMKITLLKVKAEYMIRVIWIMYIPQKRAVQLLGCKGGRDCQVGG